MTSLLNKDTGSKSFIRLTFLIQHILTKYECMVHRIAPIDDDEITAVYYSRNKRYTITVQVGSDPEMAFIVTDDVNKQIVISKDFKDYNCLAEAFNYFKICDATTTTDERNNDEKITEEKLHCTTG